MRVCHFGRLGRENHVGMNLNIANSSSNIPILITSKGEKYMRSHQPGTVSAMISLLTQVAFECGNQEAKTHFAEHLSTGYHPFQSGAWQTLYLGWKSRLLKPSVSKCSGLRKAPEGEVHRQFQVSVSVP